MIRAAITGIGAYLPPTELDNYQLAQMTNTTEEWIWSRMGIRKRHVLEPGKGSAYMATKAVKDLMEKKSLRPEEIDLLICATITPSYGFPCNAVVVCDYLNLKNAFAYDLSASCSGFLFGLETCAGMIASGKYKKIIFVTSEKLTAVVDYTDPQTSPLFGDGAAAVLVEPTTEDVGLVDSILHVDGGGRKFLYRKMGGTLQQTDPDLFDRNDCFLHQDGRTVFKRAVSEMSAVTRQMMEKQHLTTDDIDWFVPHQANGRIIRAIGENLQLPESKLLSNIETTGNTSAASIPLCLWEYEQRFRKGDTMILTSFGAGFTWGSMYLKWAYDPV
ncbi:MAG: ketoacyl-ACP synthase III [Paludibacteraceae bacterium]|nr:ketoacyl-ACP synthase III [Paludibacteraceae bacterium]